MILSTVTITETNTDAKFQADWLNLTVFAHKERTSQQCMSQYEGKAGR